MADYGGNAIFGSSVSIVMSQNPDESQQAAFFGETGIYSLWGGGRGRAFEVSGVLVGASRFAVDALKANFLTYADGIGRTLTDTGGVAWPNVVFTGAWKPTGKYSFGMGGVCLPYAAMFEGRQ